MFRLVVPAGEWWDELNNEFIYTKRQVLQLEHSLVSISKWESKWGKPFLDEAVKTREESLDYIRCMTMTQNVDPNVYLNINDELIQKVDDYINAKMTATTFTGSSEKPGRGQKITSELIYYWMIAYQVPMDCQKWHLNRLLTLIRICEIKNSKPKKMSEKEVSMRYEAINEARKKKLKTKG
nr:MAG TPA: hypothetical protein [Caudoviricetes sp.]